MRSTPNKRSTRGTRGTRSTRSTPPAPAATPPPQPPPPAGRARSPQPSAQLKASNSWMHSSPSMPQLKVEKETRSASCVRARRLSPLDCSGPVVVDSIAGSVQRTASMFQTLTSHLLPTKQDIEATVETYNLETRRLSRRLSYVERTLTSPRCSRAASAASAAAVATLSGQEHDPGAARQQFLASPRRAHRLSVADVTRYGVEDYPKDNRKRRNSPYRCDVSGVSGVDGDGGGGGGGAEAEAEAEAAEGGSCSDVQLVVPSGWGGGGAGAGAVRTRRDRLACCRIQ